MLEVGNVCDAELYGGTAYIRSDHSDWLLIRDDVGRVWVYEHYQLDRLEEGE